MFVKVSKRFNRFWIPPDQGYKLGPSGGLADPNRNVRKVKKTPKWPKMGDFGEDGSLDGVIVGVLGRFNLFWIPPDQGYKLGPPGGLADPIRNVRNVRKTPDG